MGCPAGVEDPHDVPLAIPDVHRVPDIGVGKALVNGLAHHHFPLPRRKPAALHEMHPRPHLNSKRGQEASGDVHFPSPIFSGQHDHKDVFPRDHRFALAIPGHTRQLLDNLSGVPLYPPCGELGV